jgi:hypothetical protein
MGRGVHFGNSVLHGETPLMVLPPPDQIVVLHLTSNSAEE